MGKKLSEQCIKLIQEVFTEAELQVFADTLEKYLDASYWAFEVDYLRDQEHRMNRDEWETVYNTAQEHYGKAMLEIESLPQTDRARSMDVLTDVCCLVKERLLGDFKNGRA